MRLKLNANGLHCRLKGLHRINAPRLLRLTLPHPLKTIRTEVVAGPTVLPGLPNDDAHLCSGTPHERQGALGYDRSD